MSQTSRVQIFSCIIFLALSFFPVHAIAGQGYRNLMRETNDEPTIDRGLEKRLKKPSIYKIKTGDSFRTVAHFLYGHYSWWNKIREQNPSYKNFSQDQQLPVGVKISYLAPEIGEIYEVRQNDWLARIAQWKYGDSDYWQELFQKNIGKIRNPDFIHPGDRLILGLDGTVHNAKTGEKLMQGISEQKSATAPLPSQVTEPVRTIAEKKDGPLGEIWTWSTERPYFFFGFFSGIALLFTMLLYTIFQQFRFTPVLNDPKARSPQKSIEDQEDEPVSSVRKELHGYPNDFKKRPVEIPVFDKSLMREEKPEIDLRPSYSRLFGRLKNWKNYLNIKRKN